MPRDRALQFHNTRGNQEIAASERLRKVMCLKHNIRNVCIAAHVGHGKSTLTNSLMAGDVQMTDSRTDEDEAEQGITTKLAGVSLCHEVAEEKLRSLKESYDGNDFLINLVDTPGHVDLSYEVSAALRITDGVVIVVDCLDGVRVQTENALRQAVNEHVRPVLVVNKFDRCFIDRHMEGEDFYQTLQRVIEDANDLLSTYEEPFVADVMFNPQRGTVAFSAGLHGWAFTLSDFARMYAVKFGVSEDKMTERLWGENYIDLLTKKWTNFNTGLASCKRGFVQFVYEPIKMIINTSMNNDKETLWRLLRKLRVTIKSEEKELMFKQLMRCVMKAWLPADKSLVEMMIFHLPSPHTAQRYRVDSLYDGPLGDLYADSIRQCDPNSHLMLYVSKLIPADNGRYFALGRVFAGTVSNGMKVRIMGPSYVTGEKRDLFLKVIPRTFVWMGKRLESVEGVPCGNVVALAGLDQFMNKNATLTSEREVNAHPIRALKFSVSPIVRVAVQCEIAPDLPKLVEGLRRLVKSDVMVVCTREESGEHVVSGVSDFHIEFCLKDLETFMGGAKFVKSDPQVYFRETVTEKSNHTVMSRTPNRQNRLYMEASPMDNRLAEIIDQGFVGPLDNPKVRNRILQEEFHWGKSVTKKIWCLGPDRTGANLLVDMTKGPRYLSKTKESVVAGFQWGSNEGVLAEEKMWGVCFEVCDAVLHPDVINRSPVQVIPTTRKLMYAAQLTAKPRLLEPIYMVEIQFPECALSGIYSVVRKRRGHVFEPVQRPGSFLYTVRAHLPVIESFGFAGDLRASTDGQASAQCVFSHWNMVPGDPLVTSSQAGKIVAAIRKRKGLKEKIPLLSELEDEL